MRSSLRDLASKMPGVGVSPSNLSQTDTNTPTPTNNDNPTTADSSRLQDLGYKQELAREWSLLHNFGVSFSIISMITGITTLMEYGLTTGGPAVVSIGWMVVCFFTMFVGLGMAEITSAIPTSGGPYFWAAMLAPPKYSAFFAWMTGWFNFLGQVAVTTGISFGAANLISVLATVKSSYTPSAAKTIGIYAALLVSHAILNTFGVKILKYLNNTSIILHSLGVTAFAIAVVAKAPTHQSAKFVFATYYDGTGVDGAVGWGVRASPAYVCVCGLLMAQYTITGFDASAHLSEETKDAAKSAPKGVLMSIGVSWLFGWFLILCLLFSIQDFQQTIGSAYGQPVLQILVDVFGEDGAIVLFTLVVLCVYHAGLFSLTSNSRMMFSFARDRGIPSIFRRVDHNGTPVYTIWLAAFLAFCLALPSLGSSVAFTAATSIATIGLYISYSFPILIGLIWHDRFESMRGPFYLGRMGSRVVALVACAWTGFIIVVFCLPELNPVNSQTLNYTPVAVGIIAVGATGSWVLWARRWFTGPVGHMVEEEGVLGQEAAEQAREVLEHTKHERHQV